MIIFIIFIFIDSEFRRRRRKKKNRKKEQIISTTPYVLRIIPFHTVPYRSTTSLFSVVVIYII